MTTKFALALAASAVVLTAGCSADEPAPATPTQAAPPVSQTDQEFHRALVERFSITTVGSDAPKYAEIACGEPDPSKAAVAVAEFNRKLTIKQGRDVAATAVEFYCPK